MTVDCSLSEIGIPCCIWGIRILWQRFRWGLGDSLLDCILSPSWRLGWCSTSSSQMVESQPVVTGCTVETVVWLTAQLLHIVACLGCCLIHRVWLDLCSSVIGVWNESIDKFVLFGLMVFFKELMLDVDSLVKTDARYLLSIPHFCGVVLKRDPSCLS